MKILRNSAIACLGLMCISCGSAHRTEQSLAPQPLQTEHTAVASNSAVPSSGIVYIRGHEVKKTGVYPWHVDMTATDLIRAAGGVSEFAGHSQLRVTHVDGTKDLYSYSLILSGKIKDPTLREGDNVFVATSIW